MYSILVDHVDHVSQRRFLRIFAQDLFSQHTGRGVGVFHSIGTRFLARWSAIRKFDGPVLFQKT